MLSNAKECLYLWVEGLCCDICSTGSHFEYHFWKKICLSNLPNFLTLRKWPKRQKNHSWGAFSLSPLNCWRNFIIENVWVYGPKELESSWNWHFLTWWKYQIFNILNVLLNFDLKCCILSMNAYSYFWMSLLWYLSQWEPFWISFLKTKMCSSHLSKFLTHRKWLKRQSPHSWGTFSLGPLNY